MREETRTAVYDEALRMEAYRFTGVEQPFPSHFHTYYVIGLMEDGQREYAERKARRQAEQENKVWRDGNICNDAPASP